MKANLSISLRPFDVPDVVHVLPFGPYPPSIHHTPAPAPYPALTPPPPKPPEPLHYFAAPLRELDPATLEDLCAEFKAAVYRKAQAMPPATAERAARPILTLDASRALDVLKEVLNDAEGGAFISLEDREAAGRALCALDTFLNSL